MSRVSDEQIDRGKNRIPKSVLEANKLLEDALNGTLVAEPYVLENKEYQRDQRSLPKEVQSNCLLSRPALDFVNKNIDTAEALIHWYSGISSAKSRDRIMLGIPNFPIQVKVNSMSTRLEGHSLTVFVKSDNALEISLPIASEVVLNGNASGEELKDRPALFLGEVIFDKNFLFKILIFVLK